ncbi:MAG TPA: MarC family protein [Stellaceae bacterium]|nr:MarC family protein [Stellaceae bacterium]
MKFELTFTDIAILFFLTLGPLKAIVPFVRLTRGADPAFRRAMAWQSTAIATVIVFAVALLGSFVLVNWQVSPAAIGITGAIILFQQALGIIMQTPTGAPAEPEASRSPPSPTIAAFPLAIPALVSAPGIAAITAIIILNKRDLAHDAVIGGLLLGVMALNLLTLRNIDAILNRISPGLLYLVGWVMAVLQAALAVQLIIHSLRVLEVLRWPVAPA